MKVYDNDGSIPISDWWVSVCHFFLRHQNVNPNDGISILGKLASMMMPSCGGSRVWLPTQALQHPWVQIQHPPAQWNLRGGRWSSVEYCKWCTRKNPQKIPLLHNLSDFFTLKPLYRSFRHQRGWGHKHHRLFWLGLKQYSAYRKGPMGSL
jgi:hypothetical protein